MQIRIFIIFLFLSITNFLFSQDFDPKARKNANIKRATGEIKIDGLIDDAGWQDAGVLDNFIEKFPQNGNVSATKTVAKITYDDDYFYLSATCYATKPFIATTLKRDVSLVNNDGIVLLLDPVGAKSNGFGFGCSAYGVQSEYLVSVGQNDPNFDWDTKWFSEVKQYDDKFVIEMAIPFKVLRYEDGKNEWSINLVRSDIKTNDFSTWSWVPVQFPGFDLGYYGKIAWDNPPKKQKKNIAIVPYLNGAYTKVLNSKNEYDVTRKPNVGFDAKVALTSSLNLDLTTNPDFSQVDVDRQVTNLTRFSIFLPERRGFFLENGDIFSGFGLGPNRPFFSRTIGLDNEGLPQQILYGARLTGNIQKNTRIGVLNTHTLGSDTKPGQNVSVATIQQNLFGRSFIKGLFINRQAFEKGDAIDSDYTRNAGLEGTFITKDGKWNLHGGFHTALKENVSKDNNFYFASLNYAGRAWQVFADWVPVQTNYYADQGFINRIVNYDAEKKVFVRQGFQQSKALVRYNIYPKKKTDWFQKQDYTLDNYIVFNPDNSFNERNTSFLYHVGMSNQINVTVGVTNNEVALNFPTKFAEKPLPVANYQFNQFNLTYNSDKRRLFVYTVSGKVGGFYNGTIQNVSVGLIYRARPWGNFELNYDYNKLTFPTEYGVNNLQLFGGKTEFNFSRNIFWTTFVQVNTQNQRFNFNTRFQWRYKPMSDLFLVYTDNYGVADWQPKYRALVLKMSYWLNV